MTTQEFLKEKNIKMSMPTFRRILKARRDELGGAVIMFENDIRTTINIVDADKLLEILTKWK